MRPIKVNLNALEESNYFEGIDINNWCNGLAAVADEDGIDITFYRGNIGAVPSIEVDLEYGESLDDTDEFEWFERNTR